LQWAPGQFSFEATSDGEKYAVSFEIREDIVPKNSSWNAKGIEFAVVLLPLPPPSR
jgi:hypothetical protein